MAEIHLTKKEIDQIEEVVKTIGGMSYNLDDPTDLPASIQEQFIENSKVFRYGIHRRPANIVESEEYGWVWVLLPLGEGFLRAMIKRLVIGTDATVDEVIHSIMICP